MPKILSVFSTSGSPNRDIVVAGRNPYRPYGAVRIAQNSGPRMESDWEAIKACLAAGDLVIQLSHYEVDALPDHLKGRMPYGGNVRFDTPREPRWHMESDEVHCRFEFQGYPCTEPGCYLGFLSGLELGRHKRNSHRPGGVGASDKTLQ